jgi:hypothetical protein
MSAPLKSSSNALSLSDCCASTSRRYDTTADGNARQADPRVRLAAERRALRA